MGGCIYKPEYQRSPASHQKLGDRQERAVPSQPSEGANPADNPILDLSPSELHDNKHLMLKHYVSLTLLWWMHNRTLQQDRKKKGIRNSLGRQSALMSEGVNLKWPAVSTLWFIFKSEVAFSSIIIIKNY